MRSQLIVRTDSPSRFGSGTREAVSGVSPRVRTNWRLDRSIARGWVPQANLSLGYSSPCLGQSPRITAFPFDSNHLACFLSPPTSISACPLAVVLRPRCKPYHQLRITASMVMRAGPQKRKRQTWTRRFHPYHYMQPHSRQIWNLYGAGTRGKRWCRPKYNSSRIIFRKSSSQRRSRHDEG